MSIKRGDNLNALTLLGSYPSLEEGIVRKQMCIRTAYGCCQDSFDVRVKNCSSFFTFKLKPVPKCNQRYCFGMYIVYRTLVHVQIIFSEQKEKRKKDNTIFI